MKIPGYDILGKLGEGGMAVVWKAYERGLDRYVAIKILKPEFAETIEQIRDFVEEARSAARFKHPNIVQVYSIGEQDGVYYFVMEYVEGLTVANMIDQQGAVDQKETLRIALAVSEALDAAWTRARLVHRDIKPDNIMLDADGTVKVTDLGIACRPGLRSRGDIHGLLEGTPNYMSPEQINGAKKIDCRSDMYSLGSTLYHMITGRVPFDAPDAQITMKKHLNEFLPNPRDINGTVSIGTAHLISRLMMKEASNRFKDWHQALKYIRKIAAGSMIIPKENPRAVSTVLPSAIRSKQGQRRFTGKSVPTWISTPFWLMLLGFWGYLIYTQLRLPVGAKHTAPLIDFPAITGGLLGGGTATPAGGSGGGNGSPAPEVSLEALVPQIVTCLKENKLDEGIRRLDEALISAGSEAVSNDVKSIRAILKDMKKFDAAVLANLEGKVGEEVTLKIKGRSQRMVLRAISQGRVNATLFSGTSATNASDSLTNSLMFTVEDMAANERVQWLGDGTGLDPQALAVARYLLSIQAKDFSAALLEAEQCGPFADVFRQEAELHVSAAPDDTGSDGAPQ